VARFLSRRFRARRSPVNTITQDHSKGTSFATALHAEALMRWSISAHDELRAQATATVGNAAVVGL
jgi:hypothetical protein